MQTSEAMALSLDPTAHEHHTPQRSKQPSIIDVIETVQRLKDAFRPPTQEEIEILRSWNGWGPYRPAFEPEQQDEKWRAVGAQIRMLLGTEGYEAASAATPTSFFTAPSISQAIWQVVESLGFSGGAVLEPGCGTGQILSQAPAHLPLQITGVEQEPFTASVAQLLFPDAHIVNAPLQEVALPEGAFDLVVGNVPFADVPIYDRTLPFKHKLSLHNYCIYRSLQAARPGGIATLVTTHYTMDACGSAAREVIAELGLLLGAIRLPSYGHRWAKTAVITDILVLQRRYSPAIWAGHEWLESTKQTIHDVEVEINSYFAAHSEQILGTVALERGMYRDKEMVIKAPDNLEGVLERAIQQIAGDAADHKSTYIPRLDPTKLDSQLAALREDGLHEGCFYLQPPHGLVEVVNGQPKVVTKVVAELTSLVRLRDAALALIEAERDYSKSDEELRPLRAQLNRRYDTYVKQYGPLRRSTLIKRVDKETGEEQISRRLPASMYAFKSDEHYPLVLGLEIYDDETQAAKKAAIFTQRVNRPATYKDRAESPEEAIALSLDRYGSVNFAFIAQATGRTEDEVAAYLGDLVFEDPEEGRWEIASLYLSGNVRHKLDIARRALQSDPVRWQRNIDALERVQPEPLPPENIKVLLGAPWVPSEYIVQFCEETIKLRPTVKRDTVTGIWDVAPPLGVKFSPEATSTWGTSRVSAFKLVEHLLNHKVTRVEDEDAEGKLHANTEETMLAQQKKRELQARFGEWIWEDNERTKTLSALYNTLYHGVVPTRFDGSHLSFPGMDPYWQEHLYTWQRDFIARMIYSRSGLCAFPVGAGKTKIQVAGAMTLRRMGLITKAAVIVPNHLIEQITAEAKQLYPGANILMISRDDLERSRRRIFMARIAVGDYDLVVMTHSAFEAIGVHPSTRRAYMEEKLHEYRQVLYSINLQAEDRADKRCIKRIEKQMQRLRETLKEQLDVPHDAGITFEQLGISYLVVDEFHFYKNLGLPTNQEKLTVTASQRAQDMLMKMSWLEKHNGKRPFAATFTATPISNSMVEALVMLWYLDRDLLKAYKIAGVDDFASLYIESEEKIEVTPNGAGFRLYERPSKFINLPEFMHLFTTVTDIRPPDILADKRPDRLEHTVSVEPTEEVKQFVNWLVDRSEKIRQGRPIQIDGKEDNMLWVTGDGRKAALSMTLHGIQEQYPAKLDAIASEMAKVYHRWQEKAHHLPGTHKSLQIGFCDQGTPSKEKGDQVYGELKRLLVQKGVPASGIRYIHEAETDAAKAVLFAQCRAGDVAILLGSTGKLGTGTNIQTRCAAIHHCDAPWRPDEVEQREGRGQRPGNLYPVVEIFYYVQRRTFDAYSWQILANKAKFFNQIRSAGVEISREISYSDDSSLTYGQVKAAATGDILLLEHANVTLTADAFSRLHASFKRARERDRQEAHSLRSQAESAQTYLKRYQDIEQTRAAYMGEHPFMTINRQLLTTKEARREHIAKEVLSANRQQATAKKIGYWESVPIFLKVNFLSAQPYVISIGDPYTGVDLAVNAHWLEEDNLWRLGWSIEQFFQTLTARVEERAEDINHLLSKAQEFESQAQAQFPQQDAWQAAVMRKQQLDHYIDVAAKAQSEEDLQQLAQLRAMLLETAPKDLLERPQPKNTARFVLPPRNPLADKEAERQEGARIEVESQEPEELTIEEVARTIKQSVVGSKATVAFGEVEALKRRKSSKKRPTTTEGADLWSAPGSAAPPDGSDEGTLWDSLAVPTPTEGPASAPQSSAPVPSSPQQSGLWE